MTVLLSVGGVAVGLVWITSMGMILWTNAKRGLSSEAKRRLETSRLTEFEKGALQGVQGVAIALPVVVVVCGIALVYVWL